MAILNGFVLTSGRLAKPEEIKNTYRDTAAALEANPTTKHIKYLGQTPQLKSRTMLDRLYPNGNDAVLEENQDGTCSIYKALATSGQLQLIYKGANPRVPMDTFYDLDTLLNRKPL